MSVDWEAEVGAPTTEFFGGPATYFPKDGSPSFPVVGVFDEGYQDVTMIDGLAYTTDAQPAIGITDRQFAFKNWTPGQGDKIRIDDPLAKAYGVTFMVKEPKSDSHGTTMLLLMGTV